MEQKTKNHRLYKYAIQVLSEKEWTTADDKNRVQLSISLHTRASLNKLPSYSNIMHKPIFKYKADIPF